MHKRIGVIALALLGATRLAASAHAQRMSVFAGDRERTEEELERLKTVPLPKYRACVALYKRESGHVASAHREALSLPAPYGPFVRTQSDQPPPPPVPWSLLSWCKDDCKPAESVHGVSLVRSDRTRVLTPNVLSNEQKRLLASDPSSWNDASLARFAAELAEDLSRQRPLPSEIVWTARVAGPDAWHVLVYPMESSPGVGSGAQATSAAPRETCGEVSIKEEARVDNPMVSMRPAPSYKVESIYPPAIFRDMEGEAEELRKANKTIVRLEIADPNMLGYCSGFFATSATILTAGHCLERCQPSTCSIAVDVAFNTDAEPSTSLVAGAWGSEMLTSQGLDFGWVRGFESSAPVTSLESLQLKGNYKFTERQLERQNAFLLGHPGGHLEMIADRCGIFQEDKDMHRLLHTCTATEGYSGAPLWYLYDHNASPLGIHYVVNPKGIERYRGVYETYVEYFDERRVHAAVRFADIFAAYCKTDTRQDFCEVIEQVAKGGAIGPH